MQTYKYQMGTVPHFGTNNMAWALPRNKVVRLHTLHDINERVYGTLVNRWFTLKTKRKVSTIV